MNLEYKKSIAWMRENLFSSIPSSILTVATSFFVLGFFRGLFGFAMASDKDWLSVLNNMQLYMVQAYPEEDFIRVWISVGLALVFAGMSIGLWKSTEESSLADVFSKFLKVSLAFLFFTVVAPTFSSVTDNDGIIQTEESFPMETRLQLLVPSAILVVVFFVLKNIKLNYKFNKSDLLCFYLAIPIVLLWIIKLPTIQLDGSNQRIIPDPLMPIADTTKIPWTIIFGLFLAFYFIGSRFKDSKNMKRTMSISWVLLPLFIFSWIFKKPEIDLPTILGQDIPIFIGIFLIGALTITFINNPIVEKYFSIYLGVLIAITGIALFISIPILLKSALLLLVLFTIVIPAVSSSAKGKRNLIIVWGVSLFTLSVLIRGGSSDTQIIVQQQSIFGGFSLTWLLAIFGTYVSFPLGVLLALGRNSKLPIVRLVCTGIIELTRSVPYITWLFFASVTMAVFLPEGVNFELVVRVLMVTAFFSGAYFAENIRGGLQSIPKGQYEAADAIGMSPFQKTSLIVMPQALRAIIPTLVSSAITAFKDSSLVTIIGLIDFLTIGKVIIGTQSIPVNFVGHDRENLLFIAFFYWIFTFTLSRRSMKVEKRLGLGER